MEGERGVYKDEYVFMDVTLLRIYLSVVGLSPVA